MATNAVDDGSVTARLTILETRFDTELRHLATKADLERLKWQLMAIQIVMGGVIIAVLKLT